MSNSILTNISFHSNSHSPDLTPLQSEVDELVSHFNQEAANPILLASVTAGGMAYRMGRMGVMGIQGAAYCHAPLRLVSIAIGLGSEVTAFEFTQRALTTLRATRRSPLQEPSPNLWSWSGAGGWKKVGYGVDLWNPARRRFSRPRPRSRSFSQLSKCSPGRWPSRHFIFRSRAPTGR